MTTRQRITVDGNEAVASVAYRASEAIAIYPITPSSPMAEVCDEWASRKKPNLWGAVPELAEMQSEGGAAGAVHGALQAGAVRHEVVTGLSQSLPNTAMVWFQGVDGRSLLPALDLAGVEASQGSACSSGSPLPPRVLAAMGFETSRARACVRFSFAASQAATARAAGEVCARVVALLQQRTSRES